MGKPYFGVAVSTLVGLGVSRFSLDYSDQTYIIMKVVVVMVIGDDLDVWCVKEICYLFQLCYQFYHVCDTPNIPVF